MSKNSNIPFLDLVSHHLQLEEELVSVLRSALKTAGFIGGPMVEDFERDFARFCDTKYSVGVSSGTDALRFALSAAGVGEGDVVVTVPNTFIATTEAISQTGALADFVDIDERTYNMDPAKLQRFFETDCQLDQKNGLLHRQTGRKVKAIVPVHLYGQMADMDPILALAEKYNLIVIEDACQAHGAEYFSKKEKRWRKAGSIGLAAAFSFYPGKNLGACGEAGAVTTNDEALARKVKMIRDHGQAKKYYHDVEGYNGRLDAIQAGFLSVKLKHLAHWNQARRATAVAYGELFGANTAELVLPLHAGLLQTGLSLVCGAHRRPRTIENHARGCRHWDGDSLSGSSAHASGLSWVGLQSWRFSGNRTGGIRNPVITNVSRAATRGPEPHRHGNQKAHCPIADEWPQRQRIRYDSIGVMNY